MRYQSVTSSVTVRLLCLSPDARGRCLEYAEFAGPVRSAALFAAYRTGWAVNETETVARCPRCSAEYRPYGSPQMTLPAVA